MVDVRFKDGRVVFTDMSRPLGDSEWVCQHCGVIANGLLACSRCQIVHYCNAACQKAHFKAHKSFCIDAAARHATRARELPSSPVLSRMRRIAAISFAVGKFIHAISNDEMPPAEYAGLFGCLNCDQATAGREIHQAWSSLYWPITDTGRWGVENETSLRLHAKLFEHIFAGTLPRFFEARVMSLSRMPAHPRDPRIASCSRLIEGGGMTDDTPWSLGGLAALADNTTSTGSATGTGSVHAGPTSS